MKSSTLAVSMSVPELYGVSMMGERYSTSRSVTLNRAESPAPSRRSVRWEKTRCDVEEPMSMPTLVSENISIPSMSSTMASGPG